MSGGPAASPLAGVALYTMFRGDPEQLVGWCNLHLGAGAERLYVVLDCPPDGLVDRLPADPRVHWEVRDQDHWDRLYPAHAQNVERKQVDGLRWAARRALADGIGLLGFVDADEVLDLAEPLADLAARHPGAPAFTVRPREMWFAPGDDLDHPFGATLALRPSAARGGGWNRAFGWRAQFLRDGLMGHSAGKTVYRVPLVEGAVTVHQPRRGTRLAGRRVVLPRDRARLLHFDSGSVATWNAKWHARSSGRTVAAGLEAQRRAQQHFFEHVLVQPEEEQRRFFASFFGLDDRARALLEADGLLEHVDLRDRAAGPLPVPGRGDAGLLQVDWAEDRVDFQFALVCDRRFVRPTFATMVSVLSQMGDLGRTRFVVLGDGLAGEDVSRLKSLEHTRYDVQVVVHDITADLDRDVGTEDPKRATFGRIYFVDYLPRQRTVYLDGDVLATRPFPELFGLDMGDACLGGAPDSAALRLVANPAGVPIQQRTRLMGITREEPLEYLNGGVLLLNLDHPDFRELALRARALVVMYGRSLKQRDQDAMNLAFSGRKLALDSTYNYMTQFFVSERCVDGDLPRLKYAAADASLIHFSGRIKPWERSDDEFYNGMYRRLVLAAEQAVGVSCDFYFSVPRRAAHARRTPERWAEVLRPQSTTDAAPPGDDLVLVDVTDAALFVVLSTPMALLAAERDLRLALVLGGETLVEAPLRDASPPVLHLAERVAPGVRRVPVDLPGALARHGGVVRGAELLLRTPDGSDERLLETLDLVASGNAAYATSTSEVGVAGSLVELTGGELVARLAADWAGSVPLSVLVDDELVARVPVTTSAAGDEVEARVPVGDLRDRGYRNGSLTLRVSRSNVPLEGALTMTQLSGTRRRDPATGKWARGLPPVRGGRERARAVVVGSLGPRSRDRLRRLRDTVTHREPGA